MHYPLSWPFSRLLSIFGITLLIRVTFLYDTEAGVFVATSNDISGLVLEAETFYGLKKEVEEAIPNLLSLNNEKLISVDLVFCDHDHIAIA